MLPHDARFAELLARFPTQPSARNIIEVSVERIIDSCGYGVPTYELNKDRESLSIYYGKKSDQEIADYRQDRNAASLEGLPALTFPDRS